MFLWPPESNNQIVLLSALLEAEVWLLRLSWSKQLIRTGIRAIRLLDTKLKAEHWLFQVDSHFCCNCLENIPSSEAKLKKNRCSKCFDCPSCQHTLSSRATTAQVTRPTVADGDKDKGDAAGGDTEKPTSAMAKPITRKMYYLSCLACRWTSRDVGLSDQTVGELVVTIHVTLKCENVDHNQIDSEFV